MFKKLNKKCRRIERVNLSTLPETWIVTQQYNKVKFILASSFVTMARHLLINRSKKTIYSSYANCNDSWFFFEGQDSTKAYS